MIFLMQYDRQRGRLVTMRTFEPSARGEAEAARLALELDLRRAAVDHEVVVLEAADETALRRTHRRYFPEPRKSLPPDRVSERGPDWDPS